MAAIDTDSLLVELGDLDHIGQLARLRRLRAGGASPLALLEVAARLANDLALAALVGDALTGPVDDALAAAVGAFLAAQSETVVDAVLDRLAGPGVEAEAVVATLEHAIAGTSLAQVRTTCLIDRFLSRHHAEAHAASLAALLATCERALAAAGVDGLSLARLARLSAAGLERLRAVAPDRPALDARLRALADAVLAALDRGASLNELRAIKSFGRKLYAESSHFVLEFLQNADDAGARRFEIRFEPRRIVILHDGAPFDVRDVVGVTGIGQSTKLAGQIGTFGIGFKSVYQVTDCPKIASGLYRFEIVNYSRPRPLRAPLLDDDDGFGTVFALPLADVGRERITWLIDQALAIDPFLLVTLQRIRSLTIVNAIGEGRPARQVLAAAEGARGARLITREPGRARWRHRVVEAADGPRLTVAVQLDDDERPTPAPSDSPSVYAFLPTLEWSGLGFRLQGDFDLKMDREQLRWPSPKNAALLARVPGLLAQLTGEAVAAAGDEAPRVARRMLDVLPASSDRLGEVYRASVVSGLAAAFCDVPCIPCTDGSLQPPRRAVAITPELAPILGDGPLDPRLLGDDGAPLHVVDKALTPRARQVARELGARTIEVDELVPLLERCLGALADGERPHAPWIPAPLRALGRATLTALYSLLLAELLRRERVDPRGAEALLAALQALPLIPDDEGGLRRATDPLTRPCLARQELRDIYQGTGLRVFVRRDLDPALEPGRRGPVRPLLLRLGVATIGPSELIRDLERLIGRRRALPGPDAAALPGDLARLGLIFDLYRDSEHALIRRLVTLPLFPAQGGHLYPVARGPADRDGVLARGEGPLSARIARLYGDERSVLSLEAGTHAAAILERVRAPALDLEVLLGDLERAREQLRGAALPELAAPPPIAGDDPRARLLEIAGILGEAAGQAPAPLLRRAIATPLYPDEDGRLGALGCARAPLDRGRVYACDPALRGYFERLTDGPRLLDRAFEEAAAPLLRAVGDHVLDLTAFVDHLLLRAYRSDDRDLAQKRSALIAVGRFYLRCPPPRRAELREVFRRAALPLEDASGVMRPAGELLLPREELREAVAAALAAPPRPSPEYPEDIHPFLVELGVQALPDARLLAPALARLGHDRRAQLGLATLCGALFRERGEALLAELPLAAAAWLPAGDGDGDAPPRAPKDLFLRTSEIEDLVGAREELYLARPAERALGGLVHLLGLRTLEDVTVDDVLGHIDDCRRAGEPTPRRVYAWLDRAFADGRLQVAQLAGRRWVYGDDGRYEHHTKVFGVPAPELFGRHRGYWWSGKSLCPRLWSALIPQEVTTEHVLEFVRELARPIAAEGDRAALARDAATEPAEGALPVLLESCLARLGRDDATIAPDLPVIPCLSRGPDGGGELRLLPARAPRLWRSDTPALEARFARVGGFFVTVRSSRHFLDLERLLDAMEIGFLSAAHVATVVRDRGRDRTSEYEDELEALRERLSTLCDALPRIEEMYRKQDSSRGDPARWVYRERLYPLAKTGAIRVHEPLVVSYALPGVGRFLDDSAHAAFDPHSNSLFATPALVEEPALRSLDLAKCLVPTVLAGTAESLIPTLQVLLQIGDPEGVARYLDDIGCPRARPIHDLRSRLIERVGDLLRAEVLRALRARFPALHAADLTAWQTGAWLRGLSLGSDDALDDALATAAARGLLASAGLITPPPALVEALAELLAAPSLAAILDHLVPRTAAPAPAAPAVGGLGRPPPPAMDLSYTPRALPWPTLYVIARLHDRYDPQRHVWTQRAPPELAAHRAGPPGSARVWFQGQVQPGRHVLPLPLLSILDGAPVVEAGDGAAVVIGERRGLPELEVRAAGPVTLRYTARLLDRPGVAPTPVEPHLRAPTVELDALPPVARARVARLKELGSPWARAGAVADFVARYYRYDEDFLDDPQVLEVIREHPIGRGNRFLAALHAGGEGELLGRGMCTELNTLVVELLRHLGIPCVLAESWMLDGPPVQRPDHAFALAFLPEGDGVVPVPLDASLACGDPRAQPQRAPGTPTTPESYAPWQARMRSGELRVLDPVDLEREQLTKQQRALARVIELWSARKGVASPPRLKTIARIEDPARRLLETHALARALARDPLFAKALHFAGEASVDEWSRLVRELLQQRGRGLVFDLLEDLIAEGVVAISPTLARSLSDPDA